MLIRPLTLEDRDIYVDFMLRGPNEHPECFRISQRDIFESAVPFVSQGTHDFTLGGFLDEGNLGGVVSFAREKSEKLSHKGLLYRMYVSAEYAGQGLGRRLVLAVLERAATQPGLEQINLTVVADNVRAQQLYSSLGFVPFAFEKRSIKIGFKYLDEVQMALLLNN